MSQFTIVTEDKALMERLNAKMMSSELIQLEGVAFMPTEQDVENCKKLTLTAKSVEYVSVPTGTGRTSPSWNGEGLPPAGSVCEHRRMHEWQRVEVFAVKPNGNGTYTALFTFEDGLWAGCSDPSTFRPIRTPEQIAAEKRAEFIEECREFASVTSDIKEVFGMMYDAGYRQFEIVDGEA